MRRLLQGDVGSGKTLVAALAALQAIENGWQAALMAPTEILAEQHYLKLTHWLEPLGVTHRLARGRPQGAREEAGAGGDRERRDAARHRHPRALPGGRAASPSWGSRSSTSSTASASSSAWRSSAKGGGEPHQLMMSATPIPRTLSMSYYADLDVSVIDELPPGRTPVVTKLVVGGAPRRGDRARARELRARARRPTGSAR